MFIEMIKVFSLYIHFNLDFNQITEILSILE